MVKRFNAEGRPDPFDLGEIGDEVAPVSFDGKGIGSGWDLLDASEKTSSEHSEDSDDSEDIPAPASDDESASAEQAPRGEYNG